MCNACLLIADISVDTENSTPKKKKEAKISRIVNK